MGHVWRNEWSVSYLTVIVVGMTPCCLVITDLSEEAADYVFARFEFIRNVGRCEDTKYMSLLWTPDLFHLFISGILLLYCTARWGRLEGIMMLGNY